MKAFIISGIFVSVVSLFAQLAGAQEPGPAGAQAMQDTSSGTTPLAGLIEEALSGNPQILAAGHAYQAAAHMSKSAGALPDTQVMVQQFSVGSPRPFAGYTNSDFAYIGLGASQEFPYPGKRKLKAEAAGHEAEALRARTDSAGRDVIEQIKAAYFHLAWAQQAIHLLRHHDQVLAEMQQIAEAHYRAGQGRQQEVLRAQLQHTKILQEIAMSRRDQGQLESQLKQLLGRPQDSADIVAEPLAERTFNYTPPQLLQLAQEHSPEIHAQQAMLRQAGSRVDLAKKEFLPDFSLQYMYQNNDRKFRDYYMLTFGITVPNRGRRRAELAEAKEKQEREQQDLRGEVQRQMAAIQQQFLIVQNSAEQLKIYKEGLIPQAAAGFQSALGAYQANRQDFQSLLSSFLEALDLDLQYQRELAEHESALARIEALTGVTLP